jgi:hypothetical protein
MAASSLAGGWVFSWAFFSQLPRKAISAKARLLL